VEEIMGSDLTNLEEISNSEHLNKKRQTLVTALIKTKRATGRKKK